MNRNPNVRSTYRERKPRTRMHSQEVSQKRRMRSSNNYSKHRLSNMKEAFYVGMKELTTKNMSDHLYRTSIPRVFSEHGEYHNNQYAHILYDKKKKSKSILSSYVTRNLLSKVLEEPSQALYNLISNHIVYSESLTYLQYMFNTSVIHKYFKHLKTTNAILTGQKYEDGVKFIEPEWCRISQGIDLTFYNNTPIFLSVKTDLYGNDDLTIYTLNIKNHINNLKKFIKHFLGECEIENEKRFSGMTLKINSLTDYTINDFKKRTFDNIFIPQEQREELRSTIEKYISQHDWYEKNNIPNHLGILLYGEPGTGKTVLAQALSSLVNGPMYTVTASQINSVPSLISGDGFIRAVPYSKDQYRILLIEDIDCSLLTTSRKDVIYETDYDVLNNKKQMKTSSLAELLNSLDGVNAPSNIIYVFTTNHIEKLDEALIRPGRIDLKMEIGYVCYGTLCQFLQYHYDRIPDEEFEIKDNVTFATLQIEVMKGKTFEEICDYMKKEDNKNGNTRKTKKSEKGTKEIS